MVLAAASRVAAVRQPLLNRERRSHVFTMDGVRAATKFEFEKRFWIICAIYFIGFALSGIDHTSFIAAVRNLVAPSISHGSPEADQFARIVIPIGTLLVFLTATLRTWGCG